MKQSLLNLRISPHAKSSRVALLWIYASVLSILPPNSWAGPPDQNVQGDLMHVDKTNSLLVDMGYGQQLRVPTFLIPTSTGAGPNQGGSQDSLSFVFQFPQMTVGSWPGAIDIIFLKGQGKWVPTPDRFAVFVRELFYSPGDEGLLPIDRRTEKNLFDSRPPRLLKNAELRNNRFDEHSKNGPPTYTPTGLAGLLQVTLPTDPSYFRDVPLSIQDKNKRKKPEPVYVELPGSPYELYMHCANADGIYCDGYVYDKASRYEYRVMFPQEAVMHSDELFRAINQMIGNWAAKARS